MYVCMEKKKWSDAARGVWDGPGKGASEEEGEGGAYLMGGDT